MQISEGHFITEENLDKSIDDAYAKGYNKAIDDFANALCEGSKQQIELDEGVMCVPIYCKAQFCEGNCNDCVAEIRNRTV